MDYRLHRSEQCMKVAWPLLYDTEENRRGSISMTLATPYALPEMEVARSDQSTMSNVANFIATPIPRAVCNVVLQQLHDDLRRQLNFHSIYPMLNARHLLSLQSMDQSFLTSPLTTTERQVDLVVAWLPQYSRPDYLTPFMQCLLESAHQAGRAHLELVDMIRLHCDREMLNWKHGNLNSGSDSDDTERDGVTQPLVKKDKEYRRPWRHKKVIGCTVVTVTALSAVWIICSVLFATVLPNRELDALGDGMMVYDNSTVSIQVNTILVWSLTLTFLDNTCSHTFQYLSDYDPRMHFIPNVPCSELNTTKTYFTDEHRPAFLYALPGSQISVTIPANKVSPSLNTIHVWIVNLQFYNSSRFCLPSNHPGPCHNSYKCADYRDICFPVDSSGKEIVYTIEEAGYYRHIYSYANDSKEYHSPANITWVYMYYIYDIHAIEEVYGSLNWQYLEPPSNSLSLQVASAFKFPKHSCALLRLVPSSIDVRSCIKMSMFYRWDILFLTFVAYLMLVGTVSAGLGCYTVVKKNRPRQSHVD